jgi:hypothetical protein
MNNTHITLILNLIIQIYSIFCYPIVKITNVINENVATNCKKINLTYKLFAKTSFA